jgi:hypothetical protein
MPGHAKANVVPMGRVELLHQDVWPREEVPEPELLWRELLPRGGINQSAMQH